MDVYVLCTNDCVCNACLSKFKSWASFVTFAIEKGFAGRSADVTRLMSRSLAVPGATWKNASFLIFPPLVARQDKTQKFPRYSVEAIKVTLQGVRLHCNAGGSR